MMLIFVSFALACPGEEHAKSDKVGKVDAASVSQANGNPIVVGGISCSHCVEEVKNAIKSVEGVKDVSYDTKENVFYVVMKDGYSFDEVKIKTAIEKAGYSYKGLKNKN
ncbi:MAG: heavy-metal-associated domain-containing protein [candidate division WOR-3 bacterium]